MQIRALSAVAEDFDGLLDLLNGFQVFEFNKASQEFVELVAVLTVNYRDTGLSLLNLCELLKDFYRQTQRDFHCINLL
jgi:hypothetical protein